MGISFAPTDSNGYPSCENLIFPQQNFWAKGRSRTVCNMANHRHQRLPTFAPQDPLAWNSSIHCQSALACRLSWEILPSGQIPRIPMLDFLIIFGFRYDVKHHKHHQHSIFFSDYPYSKNPPKQRRLWQYKLQNTSDNFNLFWICLGLATLEVCSFSLKENTLQPVRSSLNQQKCCFWIQHK